MSQVRSNNALSKNATENEALEIKQSLFDEMVFRGKASGIGSLALVTVQLISTRQAKFTLAYLIGPFIIVLASLFRMRLAQRPQWIDSFFIKAGQRRSFVAMLVSASALAWGGWVSQSLDPMITNLGHQHLVSVLILAGIAGSSGLSISYFKKTYDFSLMMLLGVPAAAILYYTHFDWNRGVFPAALFVVYGFYLRLQGDLQRKQFIDLFLANRETKVKVKELKAVIDAIPGTVSLLDKNLSYLYVNIGLQNYIGLRENSIQNKKMGFLDYDTRFLKKIKDFMNSKADSESFETELESPAESGNYRWHLLSVRRVENEGGIAIVALDIHDKKMADVKLETAKLRNQHAGQLIALGEMAAGVAHEINNPLAIVHAYAERIVSEARREVLRPEKLSHAAQVIVDSAARIAQIVRAMRKLTSGETNDEKQELVESFLLQNLTEIVELCRDRLTTDGVEIRMAQVPDLKVHITPIHLNQIISNLIWNSRDAVEQSDSKWIEISFQQHSSSVDIRISDSGPKIPDGIRSKLMTPFFTTKPVGKGTGVGLSISSSLAKVHGGSLVLDPNPEPTTFVLKLNIANDALGRAA